MSVKIRDYIWYATEESFIGQSYQPITPFREVGPQTFDIESAEIWDFIPRRLTTAVVLVIPNIPLFAKVSGFTVSLFATGAIWTVPENLEMPWN